MKSFLYFCPCTLFNADYEGEKNFTELTVSLFSFKGKTVLSIQEKQ